MKKLLGLAGGLGLLALASPAWANCNATANPPALTAGTQPCSMDLSGNLRITTAASAGSNGTISAAGTNGTVAQAIQGITNGVPLALAGINGTAQTAVNPLASVLVPAPSNSTFYGITPAVTPSATGSLAAKTTAGDLYGISVVAGAAAGFLLVGNGTAVPADGAVVPLDCIPVAINGYATVSFNPIPQFFSTGIWAAFSTTGCYTKTLSATAYISANVK